MSPQPEARVHADLLSEAVRPCIDYVRSKRFRSGNFPSSLSNESDRLVHWCHGAAGVIHLLLQAHKVRLERRHGSKLRLSAATLLAWLCAARSERQLLWFQLPKQSEHNADWFSASVRAVVGFQRRQVPEGGCRLC